MIYFNSFTEIFTLLYFKFNFLKLLKQFKIFEFDKFMKWLEKLVYDYQRIGYNVIGKCLSLSLS